LIYIDINKDFVLPDNKIQEEYDILDLETFDDLLSILEDGFYDLLNDFIDTTPSVLIKLKQAISASDFESIFNISHGLHGSAGNLGISQLSALLQQMQQFAKSEEINNCIQLKIEIDVAFEQAKETLLEKMN